MIKVMFVCHGNICRSPMAEFVLKFLSRQRGCCDEFYISSSATSREEIGNPVHYGTKKKLDSVGIPCEMRRAVQFRKDDYNEYDYIIVMDSNNIRNLMRIIGEDSCKKVYKLLDFAGGGDISDPWYTGDFDKTFEDVKRGCEGFLDKVLAEN